MKRRPVPIFILLTALAGMSFLTGGCAGGGSEAEYPFKDGDYFIFEKKPPQSGITIFYEFRIESTGSGFTVRRFQEAEAPSGEKSRTEITHSEKVYDRYGRLLRLADGRAAGRCRGNYCFLWIKPGTRSAGSKIKISEIAVPLTVEQPLMLDGRRVLPIYYGNSKYYYDAETGLLVDRGTLGKLTDTNRRDLLCKQSP